jgi:uncharacterized protein
MNRVSTAYRSPTSFLYMQTLSNRKDAGVTAFIRQRSGAERTRLSELRDLIVSLSPDLAESIKYKVPFYTFHGLMFFMNPKPDRILIGVCNGTEFEHPLLTGTGKMIRHISIPSAAPLDIDGIAECLQEALLQRTESARYKKSLHVKRTKK